jgi:hypothetical protein
MQVRRVSRGPLLVGAALVALTASLWFGVGSAAAVHVGVNNDNFNQAIDLGSAEIVGDIGDNIGATKEAGEPNHGSPPNNGGKSAWWQWTAPRSGTVTMDVCPGQTNFDTLLGVYTGNAVNNLSTVAASDDACGLQSLVQFPANAGTTYRIAVDGFNFTSNPATAAQGTIDLLITMAPTNDNRANAEAVPLNNNQSSVSRDNLGATTEPGEVTTCDDPDTVPRPSEYGTTVWFVFDPPSPGTATFRASAGGAFDPVMTVYRSDGVTPAGCDDDVGDIGGESRVQLTYGGVGRATDPSPRLVQIGGYQGDQGNFTYSVEFQPASPVLLRTPYDVRAMKGKKGKKFSKLKQFRAEVDPGTQMLIRCEGRRCPFDQFTTSESVVDIASRFRKKRVRKGTQVEVFATKQGQFGRHVEITFKKKGKSTVVRQCIEAGDSAEPNPSPGFFACPV